MNIKFYFDNSKLDFVSGPENINIDGDRIMLVWYDQEVGKAEKDGALGSLKFKSKEEGVADLTISGQFYDKNGDLISVNPVSTQVNIGNNDISMNSKSIGSDLKEEEVPASANTNLETFAVENTLLYPPFDNDVTDYNAEVSNSVSVLNILAIPEDEDGSVVISGDENMSVGDNEFVITVTAPDGVTKKEIVLNVHRRNTEEEEAFDEEQESKSELLKNAYEIEKVSIEDETQEAEQLENKKTFNYVFVIVLGVVLVIGIFCLMYFWKNT